MIHPIEIRSRFKDFAGAEKYRRFIKAIHDKTLNQNCLRYWQEKLWNSFVALNADCLLSISELRNIFNICELHETELVQVEVPVYRGLLYYPSEYDEERASSFPHAVLNLVMVSDTYEGTTSPVWVCANCNDIQSKYCPPDIFENLGKEVMSEKQRLPEVGEYVRTQGVLVSTHDITPPHKPLIGYIFQSHEADLVMRLNGEYVKKFHTYNDFNGLNTCLDAAIEDAKKMSEKYGPAADMIVMKRTCYSCHIPSSCENLYDKEFFDFMPTDNTFAIRDEIPGNFEVEYWSSKRGFIEQPEVTN